MDLVLGAVDPRGGYVSKILHVKMKESGPVGGARAGRAPLDPPMKSAAKNPRVFSDMQQHAINNQIIFMSEVV